MDSTFAEIDWVFSTLTGSGGLLAHAASNSAAPRAPARPHK
jgi:hypothetical protein